jgi:hypothetical protein
MGLAIFSLLLFCGLGYPVALMLPKSLPDRLVAAPVFGLALYGVVTSICYRYGADLRTVLLVQTVVASTAMAHLLGRTENRPWIATVAAATLAVAVLCILPLWVGGYQFAMFQGNITDQFNYVSESSAYAKFGYVSLKSTTDPQRFVLAAIAQLDARPTVGIMLASLWPIFYATAAAAAYPFLVTLQVVAGFGMLFVARNVFGAGKILSLALMVIFSISFFIQYVVDINAWSSLSVMSFWPVLVGMICIALTQSPVAFLFPIAAVAAGILYFYPESSAIGAAVCAAVTVSSFCMTRPSLRQATTVAAVMISSVVLAGTACIPLWHSTVGFLIHQTEITSPASTAITIEWFKVHDAFYSSGDRMLKPIASFQDAVLYPIDLLAGLQGLYFLAPPTTIVSHALGVLWRISEGLFVVSVLAAAVIALFRTIRAGGVSAAFMVGSVAGLAVPASLALSGQYWAAGKAVSMAAPFVFAICVAPIFLRGRLAAASAIFLVLQLGFGLQRINAAAHGPVRAEMPYPSIPYLKLADDWDVERWQNSLIGCKRIFLDLEDPAVRAFAETVVSDLNTQAVPLIGLSAAKASDQYDCEMTDKTDRVIGGRKLTFVKR